MKDRFPNYKPEEQNFLAIVVADKLIYDKVKDKWVIETLKDQTDANTFFDKLSALCRQFGFEVDSWGSKEQMGARLFKKDGKDLYTEEETLAFGNQVLNQCIDHQHRESPVIEDLREWRAGLRDMK